MGCPCASHIGTSSTPAITAIPNITAEVARMTELKTTHRLLLVCILHLQQLFFTRRQTIAHKYFETMERWRDYD